MKARGVPITIAGTMSHPWMPELSGTSAALARLGSHANRTCQRAPCKSAPHHGQGNSLDCQIGTWPGCIKLSAGRTFPEIAGQFHRSYGLVFIPTNFSGLNGLAFLFTSNLCYPLHVVQPLKEPAHGMGYPSARRDRPKLRNQLVRQRRAVVPYASLFCARFLRRAPGISFLSVPLHYSHRLLCLHAH
jgi:hypothetical protein